jgi:hypothetical protein
VEVFSLAMSWNDFMALFWITLDDIARQAALQLRGADSNRPCPQ